MDTRRLVVYTPQDEFVREIAPRDVVGRMRVEEINGEHSLTLICATPLSKGQRVLTCDHMGKWREWVVTGEDKDHNDGRTPFGHYYLIWSLQYDLTLTVTYKMPGTQSPVTAAVALAAALDGTSRWTVGTVTRNTMGGASMWDKSGWKALAILVATWGGEVDAHIEVGPSGVVSRSVCLYDKMGEQTPTRRFDWSRDLAGVKRHVSDDPLACRVIPRGKGEETDGGGYGRKITIESVNDGIEWLQNDATAEIAKVPDGSGGYEYPCVRIENGDIEDPQELKDWATSVIYDYTEPQVTYTADLVLLRPAGTGPKGVALGDAIHVVDTGFCDEGLRIHARIWRLETNELDDSDVRATMGSASATIAGQFADLPRVRSAVEDMCGGTLNTAGYLLNLIDRLNREANAAGGYTYHVPGIGERTYDVAVSDPADGDEASRVTEIRGGIMRFANSRTQSGDWDWSNVITPEGYLGLAATIALLTAGTIRNSDGSFYVDLDSRVVNIGSSPMVGDSALADLLDDARRQATDFIHIENGEAIFGTADGAVKNVIGATKQAYRTSAGDISWYGLDEINDIWKLFVDNAQINDTLQFGDFAWIARQNGNMTVKWVGA